MATFDDKLYDVAERQLVEFLAKFPVSEKADNAQYLLARAQLNQGKWEQAVKSLEEAMARWPDKRPEECRYDQLEVTPAYELERVFGARSGNRYEPG